jgi:hypothetical protein
VRLAAIASCDQKSVVFLQGFAYVITQYNSQFQFTLSVNLDIFDELLLQYDAILGAGLGTLTADDILRCVSEVEKELESNSS